MTYPTPGGTPDPYQPPQPHGQPYNPYGLESAPSSDQPPMYSQPPMHAAPPYYGPPGYAPVPTTNTLAILALVFAFFFPIAGIVMGHVAKRQIRETGEQGEGLATAGLWLSYIFTILGLLICAGYLGALAFFFTTSSNTSTSGPR